jgi:hypothetical protein
MPREETVYTLAYFIQDDINKHSKLRNETTSNVTKNWEVSDLRFSQQWIVVSWVVTPCGRTHFNPEDGGDTLLRNVGIHLQDDMVSQPTKPQSDLEQVHVYFLYLQIILRGYLVASRDPQSGRAELQQH